MQNKNINGENMKRTLTAALLACIAACVFYVAYAEEPAATKPDGEKAENPKKVNITVSKETTFITEPLNADGTVDYIAAANNMLSKGVTKDNNAAILIIKAFGPKFFRDEDPQPYLDALDITLSNDDQYFFDVYEFAAIVFPDDRYEERKTFRDNVDAAIEAMFNRRPITEQQLRDAKDWLATNKIPLQLLTEASRRECFYRPFVPAKSSTGELFDCIEIGSCSNYRSMATAFCLRAYIQADEGEIDSAMTDIGTVVRLGNLMSRKNLLLDRLICLAIESMAYKAAGHIASHCSLTAGQAKKCLAELQKLPSLPQITEIYKSSERLFALSFWQAAARFGFNKVTLCLAFTEEEKKVEIPYVELNWDMLLKMENVNLDKDIEAASAKTFPEQYEKLRKLEGNAEALDIAQIVQNLDDFGKTRRRLKKLIEETGTDDRDKLTLAVWNCLHDDSVLTSRLLVLDAKLIAQRNLAEVAFALAAYKAEKGEYPQKLADLSPDYFKSVPNDIFTDKPLIYRLTGDGYVLYSVGEDMTDDGGDEGDDAVEKSLLVRIGEKPEEDDAATQPDF